jgi:hypothetical protein
MVSARPDGAEKDPYDIAVYPVPADMLRQLQNKRFLRMNDVSFKDPGPKAVFSFFGYPGVWSRSSFDHSQPLHTKPFEFTTYAFDGNVTELPGYQPHLHLLLAADSEYSTWPDGSAAEFRDRLGHGHRGCHHYVRFSSIHPSSDHRAVLTRS